MRTNLTKVDIRLAVTDDPVGRLPYKIQCREPGHPDSEHSMAVYREGLQCFGCGKAIQRRMEALAYLLYGSESRWKEAIKVASKYTRESLDAYRERVGLEARRDPLPDALAQTYSAFLRQGRADRREWLIERRLYPYTIDLFRLGHDGTRFTIPIYDASDRLVTIRFRRDDFYGKKDWWGNELPKYSGLHGRNGLYLFPENRITSIQPTEIFVWEGELDTILSWQLNYPAITITNGAGNLSKIPRLVRERFPWVKKMIIAGDMDEPGKEARRAAYKEAQALDLEGEILSWPLEMGKDLTELTQNGYVLTDLL